MRLATLIAGIAAMALLLASPRGQQALADGGEGRLTVIAVDLSATARTARDGEVALTAGSVIAGAQKTGALALMAYTASPMDIKAYQAGDETLPAVSSLAGAIEKSTAGASDQMKAMAAAFEYMSDREAPAGSRLFIVTSDGLARESAEARDRLIGLAGLFANQRWSVDVVMLPSASPEARGFLARLAVAGAGKSYDAGVLEGLASLIADYVGDLGQPAIETQLGAGDSALAPIEVAPRSDHIAITFLRNAPAAYFELFDPRGAKADPARNPAVRVLETPSAVVMDVASPEAGTWSLRAGGAGSEVRAAVRIDNPLKLGVDPQPPIPAGQQGALAASASIDGKPVALPGATVEAAVRGADGKTVVYKLLDDGRGADQTAADGIFTVGLPAVEAQSLSEVGLKLSWANYGAVITGAGIFKIEEFPVVQVTPLPVRPLDQGAEAAIGRVVIKVGDYPYPVPAAQLAIKVRSDEGGSVASRLSPIDPLPDGRAWKFQVLASPANSGRFAVTAELNTNHLGRGYKTSASGAATSVEILPPPPAPGTPTWAYAAGAAGALVITLGIALGFNSRRPAPVGYIYDDKGRMLYDFSRVRQSPLRRLLSRNHVSCAEIPGLPVNVGTFVFGKRGMELRYAGKAQSLRVNGRPASDRVRLDSGTWLGVGGHLMTYSADRRRKEQLEPQGQDAPDAKQPITPPARRVLPGYVPGRPQTQQEPGAVPGENTKMQRRRDEEPPAQNAAASPAPAGD